MRDFFRGVYRLNISPTSFTYEFILCVLIWSVVKLLDSSSASGKKILFTFHKKFIS